MNEVGLWDLESEEQPEGVKNIRDFLWRFDHFMDFIEHRARSIENCFLDSLNKCINRWTKSQKTVAHRNRFKPTLEQETTNKKQRRNRVSQFYLQCSNLYITVAFPYEHL